MVQCLHMNIFLDGINGQKNVTTSNEQFLFLYPQHKYKYRSFLFTRNATMEIWKVIAFDIRTGYNKNSYTDKMSDKYI